MIKFIPEKRSMFFLSIVSCVCDGDTDVSSLSVNSPTKVSLVAKRESTSGWRTQDSSLLAKDSHGDDTLIS